MSSEPQEGSVREQLSAAEGTIVQNEEELCRQRRLLDISWNPQLQLHIAVLPQHWMTEEEDLWKQQRNLRVEQEEPQPSQTKEELKGSEPLQIKEEKKWLCINPDGGQPGTDTSMEIPAYEKNEHSKEELCNQQSFHESDSQDEPEPPKIKEEQEWLCISQDEEQLVLKHETDTSMGISTYEENYLSKAELNNQQSFNVTDSQDEEGNQHEESTTTDEETDPQNRDQRKRRDRIYVQNVDSSHISESQCDSVVRKKSKATLVKKCKQSVEEKRYSHIKCSIRTRIANNMSAHMKTKSEKRHYVCNECEKSFGYWSQFKIHMRTHTGEKPFSCKECDKSFSEISSLRRHIKTHTGEKPFSCKECKTSFSRISDLKTHMRTHSGERPFSCEECGSSFSHASNLKTHMRAHTGEKPFSCTECEKGFSRASHLKTHMRTHSGEKPFSCEECGSSFSQISNLKRHMKTHTGLKPFSCEELDEYQSNIIS